MKLKAALKKVQKTLSEYDTQANDFLNFCDVSLRIVKRITEKSFWDKNNLHHKYTIELKNVNGVKENFYFFGIRNDFEKGIVYSNQTISYSFLTKCEKYEHSDFEGFCISYGYDQDSPNDKKIYKSVQKQVKKLQKVFTFEQLEAMQEIQ